MDISEASTVLKCAYETAIENNTPVALSQDAAFVLMRHFRQIKYRAFNLKKRQAKAAKKRREARAAKRAAEAEIAAALCEPLPQPPSLDTPPNTEVMT